MRAAEIVHSNVRGSLIREAVAQGGCRLRNDILVTNCHVYAIEPANDYGIQLNSPRVVRKAILIVVNMTVSKSHKKPMSGPTNRSSTKSDARSNDASNLRSLLETPPKLAVIQSRETVAANKSNILKALRRGHRIEDIAQALSMPIRTFTRRLKEQEISVRSVRKQYQRSA